MILLQVRLIDVGNVEVVDVSQLLCLPQTFVTMPPQVLEVYLCGIKPRDGDLDWPFEVISCSFACIFIVQNFLKAAPITNYNSKHLVNMPFSKLRWRN